MRKLYWYLSAFFRKHGLVVAGSVIGAIALFSLFIPFIARVVESKPRTHIGLVGSYTLQTLPIEIQQQISSGLTRLAADGTVNPDLATRWSIEDEGRTYRFIIRDDLTWQDGQPLEPADINYAFQDVETVATQNDVVFKLPDTFVPFPTNVTQPLLRLETKPLWFFWEQPHIVGLDVYSVIGIKQQGNQVKEIALDGPEEQLVYRFYLTEPDAVTGFKLGEVDVLLDLSSPYGLDNWPGTNIVKTRRPDRYLAVFFDHSNPLFTKNIRQALSYSLEKKTDETRAIGPINPNSWAYLEGAKAYEYDLERAIERMLVEVPQEPISFELTTSPAFQAQAESIRDQWLDFSQQAFDECLTSDEVEDKDLCENIKMTISIRVTNFPDTNNFEAMLLGQESPPDPDQYALWHSKQVDSTNFSHYENTRIDKLLEEGRQVADKQERLEIYQEFQQFFLEDAPAIFLEHLVSYDISR